MMSIEETREQLRRIRIGQCPPEKDGEYWTKEMKKELEQLYYDGFGISKLALRFGRNETAVIQQLIEAGVFPRKRRSRGKKQLLDGCLCEICEHRETCFSNGGGPAKCLKTSMMS